MLSSGHRTGKGQNSFQFQRKAMPKNVQTGFRKGKGTRMWSTGEGNGKPLQYSFLENPMNSRKRQNDRIPK